MNIKNILRRFALSVNKKFYVVFKELRKSLLFARHQTEINKQLSKSLEKQSTEIDELKFKIKTLENRLTLVLNNFIKTQQIVNSNNASNAKASLRAQTKIANELAR